MSDEYPLPKLPGLFQRGAIPISHHISLQAGTAKRDTHCALNKELRLLLRDHENNYMVTYYMYFQSFS